ncbi:hypothetical protein BJX76DRAFT_354633 [Aspergillus varians]
MHLLKPLTLLCLSTSALTFKIRAFSGPSCTGSAREINVHDNTCRDSDVPTTRSFRVLSYGAGRQRAVFWREDYCLPFPADDIANWWADGGSDEFKKDACLDLEYGAKAYGSSSA